MKRAAILFALILPGSAFAAALEAHCYKLNMSPWSPPMHLGGDEVFTTLPKAFELTNQLSRTIIGEREEYLIGPALGAEPSHWFKRKYWYSKNGLLNLVWTNGFSGVSMDLTRKGTTLSGSAHTFWDFDRKPQTSTVAAQEVACSASAS